MVILSIETSTPDISVAILKEDVLLCEIQTYSRRRQPLLAAIEKAFWVAELEKEQIDGIAYAKGPGAFTGLRVGLSTAKGLAFALQKPLVAISTLLGFAHLFQGDSLVAPLLDAKKGQIYGALYQPSTQEALVPESAIFPKNLIEKLTLASQKKPILCVGDGCLLLDKSQIPPQMTLLPMLKPQAKSIAQLGAIALEQGKTVSLLEATPTYLRLPEALVQKPSATSTPDIKKM